MRVRIKDRKRFSIGCVVLLLMILNLIFALSKRSEGIPAGNEFVKTSYVALAADKDGSISSVENKYFKKYVIDGQKDFKDIKWEDTKDFIEIHLNKDDLLKVNLKGDKPSEAKDIFYDNLKDGFVIKIKKNFNENNFVYLDKNNSKKINILVSKLEKPFHNTVVIDAGHGGVDKGANKGNIYEKDLTLKIANYALEELRFAGYKVVMTRDSDKLLSLREIGDITNAASADVFVSVHINENKSSVFKGITSYYYDPNGFQKNERMKFAKIMQDNLIKSDEWEDRGILRQNLAVLRYSQIPCVLIECGFLSNEEDKAKLSKDEVLRNIGVNIEKGITNYLAAE
ncbi:N-acetylmuramoyl-L-alanine amidase [Clostridiales bacterium oral taxon 876 str. F0540]|nr:N-acetylmuramoyl-L-alanine amidase [Clostridiales bacterium oral taxon 876 str. F0540]